MTFQRTYVVDYDKLAASGDVGVCLVRLAICWNDVRDANAILGEVGPPNKEQDAIAWGRGLHSIRMCIGHLSEGLIVLEQAMAKPALAHVLTTAPDRFCGAFARLRETFSGASEHDMFRKASRQLRNKIAFHYDPVCVCDAIRTRRDRRGLLTLSNDPKRARFGFADDLVDTLICRQIWGLSATTDEQLRRDADAKITWISNLAIDFLEVVGYLIHKAAV